MSLVLVLLKQVILMFLLIGVGFLMFRGKKISLEGSKTLANILIYLSLPCVIINGFLVERTPESIRSLLLSMVFTAIVLLVCIVVSALVFRKDPMANFASTFSNPGFFGVPIIVASLGQDAVFYIAAYIAFLNLLQWTYGISIMTGKKGSLTLKNLVTAPFMVGIIIGLFFFFTGIEMPSIPKNIVSTLANTTTPLSMFTIGVYLAQTDLKKMLSKPVLYGISFSRLILIPAIAILILSVVPESLLTMKLAILIAVACPVGANIAVYAQLHGKDYSYAVETVVISTLLSIITLPIIVQIAQLVW